MPQFQSNGAELFYACDGRGQSVVLLHCLPLDHRMWLYQNMVLAAERRTLALDFRGLGLSQKTREAPVSVGSLAQDVCNMMTAEGVDRATIVGLSLGGAVAQHLAVHHQDRVEALVVAGSNPTAKSDIVQRKFSDRAAGYRSVDAMNYYRNHVESLFSPDYASSPLGKAFIYHYSSVGENLDFWCIANLFDALKSFDLGDRLGSVSVPTLVIAGEKDRAFFDTRTIADSIPGAIFVPVPGSGHAVAVENPMMFNEFLLAFLKMRATSR